MRNMSRLLFVYIRVCCILFYYGLEVLLVPARLSKPLLLDDMFSHFVCLSLSSHAVKSETIKKFQRDVTKLAAVMLDMEDPSPYLILMSMPACKRELACKVRAMTWKFTKLS